MRVVVWNFDGEENNSQGDELCLVNKVGHTKDFDPMGLATLIHIKL